MGQDGSGQVRLGQDRSGQVRSGQVWTGQDRSGQVMTGQDKQVMTGKEPTPKLAQATKKELSEPTQET